MNEEMDIGRSYNFNLTAEFGGHVIFKNATILAVVNLDIALGIQDVVSEHNQKKYGLDIGLQAIDMTKETYYVVAVGNTSTRSVIPKTYVDPHTISEVSVIRSTFRVLADSAGELDYIRNLLKDNGVEFEEVGSTT